MPDWPNHGNTSIEVFSITPVATENTYQELLAASAAPIKKVVAHFSLYNTPVSDQFIVYLATGIGGSEVPRDQKIVHAQAETLNDPMAYMGTCEFEMDFPTGTRIAIKYDNVGGTSAFATTAYTGHAEERAS